MPRFRKLNFALKPGPSQEELDCTRNALGLLDDEEIDILVPKREARLRSKTCRNHLFSEVPSKCKFAEISPNVYVASPEMVFLQMSQQLDLVGLIMLGCELCGSYVLFDNENGFEPQHGSPLASIDCIDALLQKFEGIHGVKQARRALRYVVEGSASPMETILYLLLCLPVAMGGYGFKKPLMNHRVELQKETFSSSRYYVCDLFWKEASIAVEYDSDRFHTGSEKIFKDSRRRNELFASGITVITATRAQVMSYREMEKLARIIGKALGKRERRNCYDLTPEKVELRKTLLLGKVNTL